MPLPRARLLVVGLALLFFSGCARPNRNLLTIQIKPGTHSVTTVGVRVDAIQHCFGSDAFFTYGNLPIVDRTRRWIFFGPIDWVTLELTSPPPGRRPEWSGAECPWTTRVASNDHDPVDTVAILVDPAVAREIGATVDAIYLCPADKVQVYEGLTTFASHDDGSILVEIDRVDAPKDNPQCVWKTVAPGSWKGNNRAPYQQAVQQYQQLQQQWREQRARMSQQPLDETQRKLLPQQEAMTNQRREKVPDLVPPGMAGTSLPVWGDPGVGAGDRIDVFSQCREGVPPEKVLDDVLVIQPDREAAANLAKTSPIVPISVLIPKKDYVDSRMDKFILDHRYMCRVTVEKHR